MTTAPLRFDFAQPFGPLDDDVVCHAASKELCFVTNNNKKRKHSDAPASFTHHAMCTSLLPGPTATTHVWSLKITGLVADYGWNALALVLTTPPMVGRLTRSYIIISQEFAPYSATVLTCALLDDTLTMYASDGRAPSEQPAAGKEAQPFCGMPSEWKAHEGGIWINQVALSSQVALAGELPVIGVRMDPFLGNRVEIVTTPPQVKALVYASHDPVPQVYYA